MPATKDIVRLIVIGMALIGIVLRVIALAGMPASQLCGSDFGVFYAGGVLAGTPELYSPTAVQAIQTREMGCSTASAVYLRLPVYAVMVRPLTWISFWKAFLLWRLASVAAVAVFIWLWPAPRHWTMLACAWSIPLAFSITNGQDSAFLIVGLRSVCG